jgi:hypothetical protein
MVGIDDKAYKITLYPVLKRRSVKTDKTLLFFAYHKKNKDLYESGNL